MLRICGLAVIAMLFWVGALPAQPKGQPKQVAGSIESADLDKKVINYVDESGKKKQFKIPAGVKKIEVIDENGKPFPGGIDAVPRRLHVEIKIDTKDDGTKTIVVKIVKTPKKK